MNVHEIFGRKKRPRNTKIGTTVVHLAIKNIRLDFATDSYQCFHFSIIERHGVLGIK